MITWVFLHGYGFDHQIWSAISTAMPEYTTYSPDLPGFGAEATQNNAFTMAGTAVWLKEQIEMHVQGPYILAGHSMGGYVALEFLALKPDGCVGLVLLHSHGKADDEAKKLDRIKKALFIAEKGSRPFLKEFYPSVFKQKAIPSAFNSMRDNYLVSIHPQVLSGYMRGMASRTDHMALMASLDIPILLYHGLHDSLIPRAHITEMASIVKKGMLVLDDKSGHMSMFENKEMLVGALRFFGQYVTSESALPD